MSARGSDAVAVEALTVAHGAVPAVHDISFVAQDGQILSLLGPSGCGKTTTLRAIAGLETPQRGRVAIGGRIVFDAASGINLPPERRSTAMVFQSYAIWPHMTVYENVAFGLRARRVANAEVPTAVRRSLDLVGLAALADRPATRLSGGQQQRVAVARAIAGNPQLILLDEPLSNLDAQLRLAMRAEFRELQRRLSLTAIYVTHDQEEALVLSDRILVMREGSIEQIGAPEEIYAAPASRFVAEFIGVRNIFPCEIAVEDGFPVAILASGLRLPVGVATTGSRGHLCFRPISVHLSRERVPGAHPATLVAASFLGDLAQYELRCGELSICARGLPHPGLVAGNDVFWSVPPEACFVLTA